MEIKTKKLPGGLVEMTIELSSAEFETNYKKTEEEIDLKQEDVQKIKAFLKE